MDARSYLDLTEHAVRYFYAGLDACWRVYEEALDHWDMSRIGHPLTEEEMERARKFTEQADKYFNLKFSEATLAGSIVQVAVTSIRLFSTVDVVPEDAESSSPQVHKPSSDTALARESTVFRWG
jgi:hypothetical protein